MARSPNVARFPQPRKYLIRHGRNSPLVPLCRHSFSAISLRYPFSLGDRGGECAASKSGSADRLTQFGTPDKTGILKCRPARFLALGEPRRRQTSTSLIGTYRRSL